MFTIQWQTKAKRQIERITDRSVRSQIFDKIDELSNFPHCRNIKMLKNHSQGYRLRVGRYRVLFNVSSYVKIIYIEEVVKRDDQTY